MKELRQKLFLKIEMLELVMSEIDNLNNLINTFDIESLSPILDIKIRYRDILRQEVAILQKEHRRRHTKEVNAKYSPMIRKEKRRRKVEDDKSIRG